MNVDGIPINTLFARAVLCGHVDGELDTDARQRAFYAAHPYGMSLLWGEHNRAWIEQRLRRGTPRPEWLQVYPNTWVPVVESVLGESFASGAALRCTRVNFTFDVGAYRPVRGAVVRATAAMFELSGSVVPRHFWRDADQWSSAGGGYAAIVDGELAALAFCSYRHDRQLEIGIETVPHHRGKGLAQVAASALIDHCLVRGLEPVWACRYENVASYRLALRLGFVPTAFLPYYRLAMHEQAAA